VTFIILKSEQRESGGETTCEVVPVVGGMRLNFEVGRTTIFARMAVKRSDQLSPNHRYAMRRLGLEIIRNRYGIPS